MFRVYSTVSATLLALAVTQLTSCASVLSDNSYDVAINSAPSNAHFTISNHDGETISSGTTPAVVHLNTSKGFYRRAVYVVSLQREGYGDVQKVLRPSIDASYFGNLLLSAAGVIGALVIDPFTGAMYTLPLSLDANLPLANRTGQGLESWLNETELSLPQLPTVEAVDNAIEQSIKGITP